VNVDQQELQHRRRTRILRAGILAAIVILILGNVFAASITVNSGAGLTFGQGQATITACDPIVDYSVASSFDNGTFKLASVVVTLDQEACNNKNLIVIPFTDSGGGTTDALATATLAINGIDTDTAPTVEFTISAVASPAASEITDTIPAESVSGVAIEIKD
jgi:hypothetical protein